MTRPTVTAPLSHRLLAIAGGLLFAASLGFFVFCEVHRYGREASPLTAGSTAVAIAINAALFSAFALHHSIFARTRIKAVITHLVPPDLERTAYVWLASLLFAATCRLWQDVPGMLWNLEGIWRWLAWGTQTVAGLATLVAARQLGILRLAGLAQSGAAGDAAPVLDDDGLYGVVRHPIYLAWIVLVWASPTMTGTRASFAALSSLYLVLAVPFEERDLARLFGPAYRDYARRVRWKIVPFVY